MPIGFGSSTLGSRKLMTSGIIQDKHLMLWYDYQYPQCYPKSGTAITNLAPGRTALHSATLSTVGYNQAQNAASLVFNGVDSLMDIQNTSDAEWETNQEITVESWVKTSSYLSVDGDVSQFIFQRGSAGLKWDLQSVNVTGGTIGAYRFRTTGTVTAVGSSTNLITNTWYHVAVTRTLIKVNLLASTAIGLYGRGFQNKATGLGSHLFHSANNSGQRITTFSNNTFQKTALSHTMSLTTGLTASTSPDVGTNDDGYWTLSLPFTWNFLGSTVATVYIGTNGYISFSPDPPSTTYTENGINDLTMPRINLFAADNSCQRIYSGIVGTTPTRVFRVVWEGTNTTSGTLGAPTIVYQIDFREDMTSTFDLRVSSNARIDPRYDLYLNGSLDASNSVQSQLNYRLPSNDAFDIRIGNYLGTNSFTYNGEIAIQRIYNRALTSQEILSNYDAEKTRFGYT